MRHRQRGHPRDPWRCPRDRPRPHPPGCWRRPGAGPGTRASRSPGPWALFAHTGLELGFERQSWLIRHDSVEAAIECCTTAFGPTVRARGLAEAGARWPVLRDESRGMFERLSLPGREGREGVEFPPEYLVVLGHQAVDAGQVYSQGRQGAIW